MKRLSYILLFVLTACNDNENASVTADALVQPSSYAAATESFAADDVRAGPELRQHYQQRATVALSNWLLSSDDSMADSADENATFVNSVVANGLAGDFGPSRLAAFNILAGNDESRDVWLSRFSWQNSADDFFSAFAELNSQIAATFESDALFFHDEMFTVRAGFLDELNFLLGYRAESFVAPSPDSDTPPTARDQICYAIAGTSRCLRSIVADRASFTSGLSLDLDLAAQGFSYSDDLVFAAGDNEYRTVPGFTKTATFGHHRNAAANFVNWDISDQGISILRIEPNDPTALKALLEGDFFSWLETVLVDEEVTLTLPGSWSGSQSQGYYRPTATEINELGVVVGSDSDREISTPFLTRLNPEDRVLIRVDYFGRQDALTNGEQQSIAFSEQGLSYSQSSSETLLNLDSAPQPSGSGGGSAGVDFETGGTPLPIPCFVEQPEADILPALYIVSETSTKTPISYFAVASLQGDEIEKTGFRNNPAGFVQVIGPAPELERAFVDSGQAPVASAEFSAIAPACFIPVEQRTSDEAFSCRIINRFSCMLTFGGTATDNDCETALAGYDAAAEQYQIEFNAALAEFSQSAEWLAVVADYQQEIAMQNDFETCFPIGQ